MLAAPEVLNGNHVLCGAETGVHVVCVHTRTHTDVCVCVILCFTGSGKTLAYLAPVMQQLKHEEEAIGVMARVNRPRAIILCPSRELASQVLVSTLLGIVHYI